ncbi:MAG TPA: hypothetical protein VFS09_04265 [Candidatus Eisenbacteria bacterium]|nr:hypothetical protein [Candidatus Eisenbacteria bacterium]
MTTHRHRTWKGLATLVAGFALLAAPSARAAGPGSGTADLSPTGNFVAGSSGSWVITYRAEEGFPHSTGGVLDVEVPAGWSIPTLAAGQPGEVTVSGPFVSGVSIVAPRTIRVLVGDAPAQKFNIGDSIQVVYGGGGAAGAVVSTVAPATSTFRVLSDPNAGDGITTAELTGGGSFALGVVPDALESVRIEDAAGVPVGALSLTADDDTTHLYLRGYDTYGNPLGLVSGAWSVSGGIGAVSAANATDVVLALTTAGSGSVAADVGGTNDATGSITVTHGAYAALRLSAPAAVTAGNSAAVTVEAVDADGNVVTSGPVASETVRFVGYAANAGGTLSDPNFVSDTAALAGGSYAGGVIPRRAGNHWIAARDDANAVESARTDLAVTAAAPDHLVLTPNALALVAGMAGTLLVESRDAFENPSPVASDEVLALWSNRPAGSFQDLGGAAIYEIAIPNGSSSASFRFRDTQSVTSGGRVRALDAGLSPPYLGYAEASITTSPASPAGSVALSATPSTLEADGASIASIVSGVVTDSFGNPVGAGVPFTVVGSLLLPQGDTDLGTPGVQWTTDASSVLSGSATAGTVRGAGSVSMASIAGSAAGGTPVPLLAGAPSGTIALAAVPASLVADGSSSAAVAAAGLADAYGNRVEDGELVTVATDLGSIVTADADAGTPGLQVAASGGAIAFTLQSGSLLGTATVSAASVRGSAAGATTVLFGAGTVDAGQSLVAGTSPATVGAAGSTVTVTLRDAQGHALPAIPADSISLAVSGVPATVTALGAATDAAGALSFTVTTTLAATATVTAIAKGVLLSASPTIDFVAGPVDHYPAAGPAPPLRAGRPDTLRVTARDLYENPAPSAGGSRMSVRVLGGLAVAPDTVQFAGSATEVPFTPTAVTQLTLLLREVTPPLRTVTYGPVAVSPAGPYAIDSLALATATLAAGDSTAVDLWIDDLYGNRQPGATVSASLLAGSGSATPASAITDAAGHARFSVRAGGTPGTLSVRFLAVGSPAPDSLRADTVAVAVIPGAAASIEIANSTGGIVAGGLLSVTLTLRDAFGNVALAAAPNVWLRTTTPSPALDNIRWTPTAAAAGTLADSAAGDGAAYQFAPADSGTATVAVRDTLAETIRLRVSGPGLSLAETAPISIPAAPPTQIAVVSGDAQSGVVADTLALPLVVRARDSFGNPTPGAVVRFTVTGGGGAIDATAGGAANSDAAADASGIARCDVWRLGTAAGAGNSARAALLATPSSFVPFAATALADTAFTLTLAPGALSLAPTQTALVTATARDAYSNPVPGAALTLYLAGPGAVDGTLQSLGGATTGGPGSQSGLTNSLGALPVRYAAPAAAPAVDSLYVRSATLAPVGIRVAVSAGATDSLRVTADSLGWIAGAPVRIRVAPLDAQGNVVLDDAGTAVMRAAPGVSFAPASGPLLGGVFETFATATTSGSIASIGADRSGSPGVGGSAGPVSVRPALPSGTIPVAASRTTLTADGRSLATVTFGPVRDAYANLVAAGTALAASATAGTLAAASLVTDASGMASTLLVAPNAAGPGTVNVVSVPAGASGSLAVTFVPPPSLAAVAASLAPSIVAPGTTASFTVGVTNTGSGTLTLGAGTSLAFGPASSLASASLAGAPVTVAPSATVTLAFSPAGIPVALPPGSYAPTLRAVGTDATGDPFDFYPSLAGALLHVAGVRVAAVGASPTPAPLGYADLQLTFTVENLAGTDATIESASLAFSQGVFTVNGVTPALPAALPALGSRTLVASVRVPASGIPDGSDVGVTMTAGARYGAVSVNGANAAPLTVPVVSGAAIAPVAGGATPARLLRGRNAAPAVTVRNNGAADVTLFKDQTLLAAGSSSGDSLFFRLLANQVVAGGDVATLAFDSLAVPAATPLGAYGVTLRLRGSESGQPFAADVAGNPASVPVVDPAILSVVSLAPDTVSAGQTRAMRVVVANAGGVPYDFETPTTLRLAGPVATTLSLAAAATAPAGGSATLDFVAAPLGAANAPGAAPAALEARGLEEGLPRDESIAAGTLEARPPAALAYVAGSASPDTVRAGQTVTLVASIRNDGGSPFLLDPASTRLTISDGVESAAGFATGAPFTLAPGAQAALTFPAVAFPSALASQPYPVTIVANGTEWTAAESATLASPAGEVRVVEPAAAIQVSAADPGAPKQAAAGAGALRLWSLTFDPLVPVGGAASTRLESVALTVLADGAPAATPGGIVSTIEARDAGGALLAQVVPAGANPATLLFAAPIDLSSGPVTLFLDVTLAAGLQARDVGLRLAAAGDVVARDNLAGSVLSVSAPGGLPFQALESRRVTLFAKAHGYPNPFRAGRESVLLSYRLGADAPVQVRIVTLLGEMVRELSFPAGAAGGALGLNEVPWDGRNGAGATVKPGVYVAHIESGAGGVNETVKVGVTR